MSLDPAQDPDRFDPAKESAAESVGPLDPASDPDRFQPRTLPEMLGEGAFEDERNNLDWLIGLVSVLLFLGLISALVYL